MSSIFVDLAVVGKISPNNVFPYFLQPPQSYLDALEQIAESARKVIVVTPPTVRVVNEDHRRAYASRNSFMAQWVQVRHNDCSSTDDDFYSPLLLLPLLLGE